ncbi:MAG: uroporphyrinogen-III synthase [Pseudomonadota bacterium]
MPGTVLTVRPQPGLDTTIRSGEALGLTMIGHPLFEVRKLAWASPDPATVDALLIGSANAIRHGGEGIESFKSKPVYAVGQTTADVARDAGFTVATIGTGGLQNVLDVIPAPKRLLRIAGADHVDLRPPEGVSIATVIAYETVPLSLPEDVRNLEGGDCIVLLHSAAAARQFDLETARLKLDRSRMRLAVIGPRVEQAAGSGWHSIHVSQAPSDAALLELAHAMCI